MKPLLLVVVGTLAASLPAGPPAEAADPAALALLEDSRRAGTAARCPGCDLAALWLQDGEIVRGSDLSGAVRLDSRPRAAAVGAGAIAGC